MLDNDYDRTAKCFSNTEIIDGELFDLLQLFPFPYIFC